MGFGGVLCGGVQRVRCQKRCCPARTTRAQRATDPRGARNTQSNTIFCRQSHLCPTLSVHRFHQIVDGGGLCGRRCAGKRGVREKGRRSEAVMLSCEDDARRRARRATGPRGAARATHKASSLLFGCSPPPHSTQAISPPKLHAHKPQLGGMGDAGRPPTATAASDEQQPHLRHPASRTRGICMSLQGKGWGGWERRSA